MGTYQITTDKGTYQVETDNPQNNFEQINSQDVNNTLDKMSPEGQNQPKAPAQSFGDQVMNNIAQFGKSAYEVTPFAKRIAQLTGSKADEIYAQVGNPDGILQNISSLAGEMAPQVAMAAPFMKGANILMTGMQSLIKGAAPTAARAITGGIVGSPMVRGAVGLGAFSGTKAALTGDNPVDATMQGVTQGLIYGALAKMGATFIPKRIPFAESLGSAVGGGIAGALTAPNEDKRNASAVFMGALAALTPEERFDFHKTLANNVNPVQWERYLREGLQIPKDDTKVILDNGMQEIERVGTMQIPVNNQYGGQDILTPVQIAQKFYQEGILNIRKNISGQFDEAIKNNDNQKPADIAEFLTGIKKQVDNYGDPTSPVVSRFNKTLSALEGFQPTTTQEELTGTKEQANVTPNLRKVSITDLPKNLQEQVRKQLGAKGDITNLNLNALHELKMKMFDAVSDKTWRDPGNTTPEERFAKSIGKQISEYIGKNNDLYKQATVEYAKMRKIQAHIMDLNTSDLGKNWNHLQPAQRADMLNTINGIGSYFKQKGVDEYNPKGLLEKYHAYNSISNPDPTSFRNNAPLKIAFERAGTIMGGIVALPLGGVHTAAIGSAVGYLTAVKYMRPSSYISILKMIKPNLQTPTSMSSGEALTTLKKIISSKTP